MMREISLHVLDLAQNSIKAEATEIGVAVESDMAAGTLTVRITDNGCGMDEETAKRVTDPFYTTRTTRKVGLGIPFFKMAAELTGGNFTLQSAPGKGTQVTAVFFAAHIDCLPLGDMGGTMVTLIQCNPDIDFLYTYAVDGRIFTADTRIFREILGEVPLSDASVVRFLQEYFDENTAAINGGANKQ